MQIDHLLAAWGFVVGTIVIVGIVSNLVWANVKAQRTYDTVARAKKLSGMLEDESKARRRILKEQAVLLDQYEEWSHKVEARCPDLMDSSPQYRSKVG